MIESKKDMVTLKVFSLLIGGAIFTLLYQANLIAFECVRVKSVSTVTLVAYLSVFLGLIAVCVILMFVITKAYLHVYIKHCRPMHSKMIDIFGFLVSSIIVFSFIHLLNILSFDGKWGAAKICILSLLCSLFGTVINLLFYEIFVNNLQGFIRYCRKKVLGLFKRM